MTRPGFSADAREGLWSDLGEGVFDLLVIGGGVTGVGIAFDAAGRGLRVALVEAGDFGGGTSSRSSRLIHGGLRYLETFDFGLVFEALRERRRLLELAPHLVHPLPFLFPIYRGDPKGLPLLAAGMWLYEGLSLFRSPKRHRLMRRAGVLREEPLLRADDLVGGALYYDAQVDDARLTLAIARAAHETGATLVSYATTEAVAPALPGMGNGHVRVVDRLTGKKTTAHARVIVNATGPWADRVRTLADPNASPRLRTTKGVHILVDRARLESRHAIIFQSGIDGRVMFVLPWGDFTYVGTTDTEYEGDPRDAHAEVADVEYLLASANGLFPDAKLTHEDIISTWAGIRPLLAPDPAEGLSESATSREHEIWRDPSGLVNVAGGKLTTYRSMAAEAVDAVADLLRKEFGVKSEPFYTEYVRLPGAPDPEEDQDPMSVAGSGAALSADAIDHLRQRYGADAAAILQSIAEKPELGRRIIAGRPSLYAEIVHAVRVEMALTLEDVLRRRLHLFDELRDGGVRVAREVAATMASLPGIGWDEAELDRQVERYTGAVRLTRAALG